MESIHFESAYVPARTITLHELLETYFTKRLKPHCKQDYNNIKKAFALLAELFPNADTSTFDGEHLEEYQRLLIRKEYDRKYINKLVGFVKAIFRWAKRKRLISPLLFDELDLVPPLKEGEAMKENPDREDAKPEDIEAVLNHLPPQIAHMLALQTLTGLRPCEICNLKGSDIDQNPKDAIWQDGTYWQYLPKKHKTSGKGVKRGLMLGEHEQAIITKYLTNNPEKPLFCNLERCRDKAIKPQRYADIIADVISAHSLAKFVPYQVRHTVCTWISTHLNQDHARAQLGHTTVKMTNRYDHSDAVKQAAVLEKRREIGSVIRLDSIVNALTVSEPVKRALAVPESPAPAPAAGRPVLRIYRGECE